MIANIMKIAQYAESNAINASAVGTAFTIGLAQSMNFLQGILPTIALLLSALCAAALLVVHVKNAKKLGLEIERLERDKENYEKVIR